MPAWLLSQSAYTHPSQQVNDLPLWCIRKQIEEGSMIQQEILWIAVLRANDIWALNRVTAEENRLSALASFTKQEGFLQSSTRQCHSFLPRCRI